MSAAGVDTHRGLCGGGGWLLKGEGRRFLSRGQERSRTQVRHRGGGCRGRGRGSRRVGDSAALDFTNISSGNLRRQLA